MRRALASRARVVVRVRAREDVRGNFTRAMRAREAGAGSSRARGTGVSDDVDDPWDCCAGFTRRGSRAGRARVRDAWFAP